VKFILVVVLMGLSGAVYADSSMTPSPKPVEGKPVQKLGTKKLRLMKRPPGDSGLGAIKDIKTDGKLEAKDVNQKEN
jgi:hypothetical protein